MKKNLHEITGVIIGGITPTVSKLIEQSWWTDWARPVILSGICSIIGLLIMHYGKRLLNSLDAKRLPKFRGNGKQ